MQYLLYKGEKYLPYAWHRNWVFVYAPLDGYEPTLQGWFEYVSGKSLKIALNSASEPKKLVVADSSLVALMYEPITRITYN